MKESCKLILVSANHNNIFQSLDWDKPKIGSI